MSAHPDLAGATASTGIPIIDCAKCAFRHPTNRKHCVVCGRASAFIAPPTGRCLNCRTEHGA